MKLKNKVLQKILSLVLAGILILTITIPVSAFSRPSDNFWVAESYIIYFRPHYSIGDTSVSHMNEALWQWNKQTRIVANRDVAQRLTEPHYSSAYPTTDEQHYVYKLSISTKSLAEATTLRGKMLFSPRPEVYDADILINSYYSYTNGASSGYDFWSVFCHEAGHTIGLNHSISSAAVMYGTFAKGELRRELSLDDKKGIIDIYG